MAPGKYDTERIYTRANLYFDRSKNLSPDKKAKHKIKQEHNDQQNESIKKD